MIQQKPDELRALRRVESFDAITDAPTDALAPAHAAAIVRQSNAALRHGIDSVECIAATAAVQVIRAERNRRDEEDAQLIDPRGIRYAEPWEITFDTLPEGWALCGSCGRAWDDTTPTAWTPTPAARCPWEADHDEDA